MRYFILTIVWFVVSKIAAQENAVFQLKNLTNKEAIHYATEQDTLLVSSMLLQQVFVVKFAAYFEAAAPPMNAENTVKASVLNVQKISLFPTNKPFQLEEGLYLFQKDTTTSEGIGLKVTKKDFPKYKKIQHLINAMIYITTPSEMASLLAADDKRLVFDNFWLTIGGSLENAQRILKLYFQRVKEANHRFTSYKEGW
ncbi:MAG: GWxTD domain-containing protein, partial [Flammeovirgaceae bacterium]|nr:GWxTD domain-containing protein [Flammeovirgaceae bacterium]